MHTNLLDSSINIETLVGQFQAGIKETFTEIYALFANERKAQSLRLRHSLPAAVTAHDIQALIDDALLTAVTRFKPEETASFRTYFRSILEYNRLDVIKHVNRKKRDCAIKLVSTILAEDAELLDILEVIEDETALQGFTEIENTTLQLLQEYATVNPRKQLNATLLLLEAGSYLNAPEKYSFMRKVTGMTLNDSAVRKKCQRAKADFKKWLAEKEGTEI
ncbi:hypothetical protein [Candidatus Enterococcus willemsii]|uniref:RNA polymerase sigma-70 region 2 domain-containing protein n=1 Tax=Candidatus Enterococcus willemsii TaxID=1857215 RepID=A0ABQ6YXB1_9ENTE|nr:hypothetical protein [Enterococcus sp. CU12B]KAF1302202.1 hypothetical protein BAU17_02165 [Enterococcus sp. CU12B]